MVVPTSHHPDTNSSVLDDGSNSSTQQLLLSSPNQNELTVSPINISHTMNIATATVPTTTNTTTSTKRVEFSFVPMLDTIHSDVPVTDDIDDDMISQSGNIHPIGSSSGAWDTETGMFVCVFIYLFCLY